MSRLRPNLYISTHSQSLRCIGNFLECLRERENRRARGEEGERRGRQPREFLVRETHETKESASSKIAVSTIATNWHRKDTHIRTHTHIHVCTYTSSRRNHSECCTASSRARVGSCADPSARWSEINYGASGGPGIREYPGRGCDTSLEVRRDFVSRTTGPRSHVRLVLDWLKRTNCEGVKLSRLRGGLRTGGSATDILL